MDLLSAALLGILQGITEWLPISSSGQSMLVLMNFLNLEPASALGFAIYLHIGTLLAVIIKFRRELSDVAKSGLENKLLKFLVVSTIFTGIVGVPIYRVVSDNFTSAAGEKATGVIGILLIVTGLVIYFSKNKFGKKGINDSNIWDMIILGAVQGLAILPGISRSGVTIAALLFRNFKQEDALKLSFLISIPAVVGAVTLSSVQGNVAFETSLFAGILLSLVTGYLAIDILLKISKKIRFDIFCVLFGLLALIFSI